MNASIIIVVFNGRKYLGRCLSSVLGELGAGDEVIVVDNASTDGGGDWINERWPEVTMIRNATNLGFSIACNQGAKKASNEILVLLNQDTHVMPGWLEGLRRAFVGKPEAGLVTSKILMMDSPRVIQACGLAVHFSGLTWERGFGERAAAYEPPAKIGAVSGASFAIRSDIWASLGGFDESLGMYYEDVDLSWRAIRQGWQCELALESTVRHEQVWAPSGQVLDYIARNRYVVVIKNLYWRTLMILLPGLFFAEAAEWGYALMRGKEAISAKWKAWSWLRRNFKSILSTGKEGGKDGDLAILDSCTYRLTPGRLAGGRAGKALIGFCNLLMYLNYRAATGLLRAL